MFIVPGPASTNLGRKVAEILNLPLVEVESKTFPDGECYVRLTRNVKDERVTIIQSTYPPQNTHLIQLFLMVDAAKSFGAKEVIVVIPYMAYARQDKIFRFYEPISIETILKIFEKLEVKTLITINIHEPKVFKKVKLECLNLSATNLLAKYFTRTSLTKVLVFAPDLKAVEMVKEASKILGGEIGWFRKERNRITGEIEMVSEEEFEVEDKNVILFDDIISTGGTTATAVKMLKEKGAKKIFSACIHPLLIKNALNRILEAGAEAVIATDTIPSSVSVVSVAPLIADTIKKFV